MPSLVDSRLIRICLVMIRCRLDSCPCKKSSPWIWKFPWKIFVFLNTVFLYGSSGKFLTGKTTGIRRIADERPESHDIMGAQLRALLKSPEHRSTILLRGALDCPPLCLGASVSRTANASFSRLYYYETSFGRLIPCQFHWSLIPCQLRQGVTFIFWICVPNILIFVNMHDLVKG